MEASTSNVKIGNSVVSGSKSSAQIKTKIMITNSDTGKNKEEWYVIGIFDNNVFGCFPDLILCTTTAAHGRNDKLRPHCRIGTDAVAYIRNNSSDLSKLAAENIRRATLSAMQQYRCPAIFKKCVCVCGGGGGGGGN